MKLIDTVWLNIGWMTLCMISPSFGQSDLEHLSDAPWSANSQRTLTKAGGNWNAFATRQTPMAHKARNHVESTAASSECEVRDIKRATYRDYHLDASDVLADEATRMSPAQLRAFVELHKLKHQLQMQRAEHIQRAQKQAADFILHKARQTSALTNQQYDHGRHQQAILQQQRLNVVPRQAFPQRSVVGQSGNRFRPHVFIGPFGGGVTFTHSF